MATECILIRSHKNMTEVLLRNQTGSFPEIEHFDQLTNFGGYAIGRFENGGTGFIVKILSADDILIATAAHIFSEDFIFNSKSLNFFIFSELFLATPVKNSIDWSNANNFYTDPASGVQISFPEDWVLCRLSRIPGVLYSKSLVSLQAAECSKLITIGTDVTVIGFPNGLNKRNIEYCAPSASKQEKRNLLRQNILSLNPVFFEGNVKSASNEVICANCSTVNGMSGSPLFIKEGNIFKVIGLLHGSRPSVIHRFSSSLVNKFELRKAEEFVHVLENQFLVVRKSKFKEKIEDALQVLRRYLDPSLKRNKGKFKSILLSLYGSASAIEEDSGNPSTYNTFISTRLFMV